MKSNWLSRGAALVLALVLSVGVGCSSSQDGGNGTGSTELTPEEQYQLIEPFADPEVIGQVMVPVIIGQAGVVFWDGVDPEDVTEFLAGLGFGSFRAATAGLPGIGELAFANGVRKATPAVSGTDFRALIAPLIRQAAVEAESVSVAYDAVKGWWFIDATVSFDFDSAGMVLSLDMSLRDSVRFETAAGTPTRDPGIMTDRIRHGLDFSIAVDVGVDDETFGSIDFDAGIDLASNVDVTGLSTGIANINGATSLDTDLNLDADLPDSTGTQHVAVGGTMGMNASMTNVQIVIPEDPDLACPSSGSMSADFAIDLTVDTPAAKGTAKGTWGADVTISGGVAQITIQSGSVTETLTTTVCSVP